MSQQAMPEPIASHPSGRPEGVSVVIPCFNRADTVAEAVLSVLNQSHRDLEVLAVDDGSEDATWEVLQGIADPRLRCLRNPGKGVSAARNHGVAESRLPWVAFQDSDDVWLPDKLARQMHRLRAGAHVAAYCGMLVKPDTRPDAPVLNRFPDPAISPLEGDILPSLVRGSYLSTQLLVIRRDIFDAAGGFDEEMEALVDWELMLRVAGLGPVAFIDEDLVIQRMSDNSITRFPRRRVAAQEHILRKHQALLRRYPGALAHHHHRLAGVYRSSRDIARAAAHARAALRATPRQAGPMLKYLAHAGLLSAWGLVRR